MQSHILNAELYAMQIYANQSQFQGEAVFKQRIRQDKNKAELIQKNKPA